MARHQLLRLRALAATVLSLATILVLIRVRGMLQQINMETKMPGFDRPMAQLLKPAIVFLCVDLPAATSVGCLICSGAVACRLEDARLCRRFAEKLERILATWHFWIGWCSPGGCCPPGLALMFAECHAPGMCLLGLAAATGVLCLHPWNLFNGCCWQAEEKRSKRKPWPSQKLSEELRRHGSTCTVCLEDFQDDDDVSLLPCGHLFHSTCINSWYVIRGTCPLRCHLDASGRPQASGRAASRVDDRETDLEASRMVASGEEDEEVAPDLDSISLAASGEDDGEAVADLEASRSAASGEDDREAIADLEVNDLRRASSESSLEIQTV